MRLINFYPSNELKSYGLLINEMRHLNQVIALFGKNGSGKSRLLNHLNEEIRLIKEKIRPTFMALKTYEGMIENGVNLDEQQSEDYIRTKEQWQLFLQDFEIQSLDDPIIIISPTSISIDSNLSMRDNDYREKAVNLTTNPSYETIKRDCAKFIKSIIKSEIANDFHKSVLGKKYFLKHDENQDKNINLLHILREYIKEIMNKELRYTTDEHLTPIIVLDDRQLDIDELSLGERELLAFCVYLVLQSQDQITNTSLSLKNKILILDEPDSFLHPKAQIDLLNGLRNLIGPGQIWLATHSIPLLSVLDRDEIWLMDNGKLISPSIETPNKVLTSLIGEENIDSLENFISSQYEWASIQFAIQCLFPPNTVENKLNDPQPSQVIKVLDNNLKPIKILDFGAGKGRFAIELIRNKEIALSIYYQALEINKNHFPVLIEHIQSLQKISDVNKDKDREILDNYLKLNEKQYTNFFDYVLLINVLHEIPINKWYSEIKAILNSLTNEGKILILEDQAIPKGENAHEFGFIILDIEEFQVLFSLENRPKAYIHPNLKYKDRLTCIEIEKNNAIITYESIYNSLMRKKINCNTQILELRAKSNKTPRDGRKNSFLTQLYANVDMASEEFKMIK